MQAKKITTIITTFALLTQLLASVVTGQKTTVNQQTIKPTKTDANRLSSKYIQDIARLVKEGKLTLADNLQEESEKIESALAASSRIGVIVTDRYNIKSAPAIENLAVRLDSDNATQSLRGKKIFKLDLGAVIADSANTAQLNARLQEIVRQVESVKDKAILYVENISIFSKVNPVFGIEIAKTLRQSIADGKIQVISVASSDVYNTEIAADTQLKNRFKKVNLNGNDDLSDEDFVGDKISPDLREIDGECQA